MVSFATRVAQKTRPYQKREAVKISVSPARSTHLKGSGYQHRFTYPENRSLFDRSKYRQAMQSCSYVSSQHLKTNIRIYKPSFKFSMFSGELVSFSDPRGRSPTNRLFAPRLTSAASAAQDRETPRQPLKRKSSTINQIQMKINPATLASANHAESKPAPARRQGRGQSQDCDGLGQGRRLGMGKSSPSLPMPCRGLGSDIDPTHCQDQGSMVQTLS